MSVEEPFFNAYSDGYDTAIFLPRPAERTAENAKLEVGQKVLDVACGTGWATMAASRIVGESGRIIGIDIADKLLDIAIKKAQDAGLLNIEYRLGDAENLEFDDDVFDAVICASSIFFLKDIPGALIEWSRVLKPGGTLVFSSFSNDVFHPLNTMFSEKLSKYENNETPPRRSGLTDTPEKCLALLKNAGFSNTQVTTEQLGFYLHNEEEYWQLVSNTYSTIPRLARLETNKLDRFKAEHLADVKSYWTDQGIWINEPVHFGIGEKPI